ncbi:MAG TPA: ribosome-associated translation inhibitor RaiA [Salinimicrobium catena]|uniref:Ribosome hibernation promoting factor n=1 Tax=Salinimicrobium catena TaxID=390640 RepID=A0A7C2M985_9FLAO|nr:ribosome-associated translation inhibitor RaiA [Salinimicrobium catena]
MNVNFTAKHTKMTAEWQSYCEKRLSSMEKRLGSPLEADIIFSLEKYRHIAEINLKTHIGTLNAVEETDDMLSSLVGVFDHLERRVKKELGKMRGRKRRRRDPEVFSPPSEEPDTEVRIIRSRDFSLKPMSVEEALLQLKSNKKEVFVFRQFETEKWTVLYRRRDGNFGLVEPE